TITSTTTTTLPAVVVIARSDDPILGIYSTAAGGPTGASNGRYSNPGEILPETIDGLSSTKYLNFGVQGSLVAVLLGPGVGTGFISYRLLVTSQRSLSDAAQYAEAEILGYI
ncbi:unnamed protein product, partial [Rotaria magnacalcarata]